MTSSKSLLFLVLGDFVWVNIYHLVTRRFNGGACGASTPHLSSLQDINIGCGCFVKMIDVGRRPVVPPVETGGYKMIDVTHTKSRSTLFFLLATCFLTNLNADNPPRRPFRQACITAQAQTDLNINKVRARLTTGGDLWWDRSSFQGYVVPASPLGGAPEVSAAGASAIWMGGLDEGGNLKLACQTYGNANGSSDFYPGPLEGEYGTTSVEMCARWDRFFEVKGSEIRDHIKLWQESRDGGAVYTADKIPLAVKGWPARGNPHFFDVNFFPLPVTDHGLADFWDNDGNGFYEPLRGDYPVVETRGCEYSPSPPDQIIFWIFNDEGGGALHGQTDGTAIRMEVQAEAFAYSTNDPLDYVTFYKYKLINRALEDIDSTYFALWTAVELGCWRDNYLGCDTSRNMAYIYNKDAFDGESDNCPGYGSTIPALGIDLIRGPLNENWKELGMSNFIYYAPISGGQDPEVEMSAPITAFEYYNYLTGRWRDRTPLTPDGYGYNPGSGEEPTNFAFPSDPNQADGWSMCKEFLPPYYMEMIQSSGPFRLKPGAINELVYSVVWAPNLDYPCPDLSKLKHVSDMAQRLFDNCIHHFDEGPDAPNVEWKEGDREVVAFLNNDSNWSNNEHEDFEERGFDIPSGDWDTTYNFEGYVLYQLKNATVKPSDLGDTTLARIAAQLDTQNSVGKIYKWEIIDNPSAALRPYDYDFMYVPHLVLDGADQGIPDSIIITEDLFATGSNRQLLNHRKYYFMAIAYAHNEYKPFDPESFLGQQNPMVSGRRNRKTYTVIPRPKPNEQDPLASINLVPNPYLAYSAYETDQQPDIVKITNLPPKCTVTIYTLYGGFVRRFNRNEVPLEHGQTLPDIEWDLRNQRGNKVASGVFLVHVKAPGLGERTLKWFGMPREE